MIGDDWIVLIKSTNFNSNSCLNPPHSKQPSSLLCGTQYTLYITVNTIREEKKTKQHFHFYSSEASQRPDFHRAVIYSYVKGIGSVMRCNHQHTVHDIFLLLRFTTPFLHQWPWPQQSWNVMPHADVNDHIKKPPFPNSAEKPGTILQSWEPAERACWVKTSRRTSLQTLLPLYISRAWPHMARVGILVT